MKMKMTTSQQLPSKRKEEGPVDSSGGVVVSKTDLIPSTTASTTITSTLKKIDKLSTTQQLLMTATAVATANRISTNFHAQATISSRSNPSTANYKPSHTPYSHQSSAKRATGISTISHYDYPIGTEYHKSSINKKDSCGSGYYRRDCGGVVGGSINNCLGCDSLSLSLSPPANRRRTMPGLRGGFVSL